MMPQKRNPDVLELIRGKTGSVYGCLVAMLTILKAQPSGYNRDLQQDKVHIFTASDTVEACLDMVRAIVSNMKFDMKKISAGMEQGFLDATSLVEYLVGKGVAFREAHRIVGLLVADCEKQNRKLAEISLDQFKQHCALIESDVYENLGAAKVAVKYVTEGAAGPIQAKRQISYWNKQLAQR
jgi:argininosuccinate lyase